MGIEEKLPAGVLLTSVEQIVGYARRNSLWPATFGLACSNFILNSASLLLTASAFLSIPLGDSPLRLFLSGVPIPFFSF